MSEILSSLFPVVFMVHMEKHQKSKISSFAFSKTDDPSTKKYFFIIISVLVVISIISFTAWNKARVELTEIHISSEDKQRLGELVLKVASNPRDLKKVYNGFWNVLDKYSSLSASQLSHLKENMRELFYLPKLFLEDAGNTVKNQSPFKSIERDRLEKYFLQEGFLTEQQVEDDKETMKLIALKKPLKASHGLEIIIEEKRIGEMLQNWNDKEIEKIIDRLFTPLKDSPTAEAGGK